MAAKRRIDNSGRRGITDDEEKQIELIERALYHEYNAKSPLVNGTVAATLTGAERAALVFPQKVIIKVMEDEEIAARRAPSRRLPRQADHFRNLLDHLLNVKNEPELRRALEAHFARLHRYYKNFLVASNDTRTADGEGVADEE